MGKHHLGIIWSFLGWVRVFEELWKLRHGCVGPVGNSHDFVGTGLKPLSKWQQIPVTRGGWSLRWTELPVRTPLGLASSWLAGETVERKALKLVILWSESPIFSTFVSEICQWVTSCWWHPMRGGLPHPFLPCEGATERCSLQCPADAHPDTWRAGGVPGPGWARCHNLPRSTRNLKVAQC